MLWLNKNHTPIKFGLQICRNYLSHEYKNAINGFDAFTSKEDNAQTQSAKTTTRGIVLMDIVNGIAHHNRNDGFESLLKLRSKPEKAIAFEATSYAIYRTFIDHENLDEVVPIIKNRLESGLFMDNFVACYLLDHFLEEAKYVTAAELGVEMYKQDTLENQLVVALILKSFFEYLKPNIEEISAPVKKVEKKPAKKSDEVKIRVKFLRNVEPTNLSKEIGKAACRIAELHKNDATINCKLLGCLLVENYDLALSLLNDKNLKFAKDTLEHSQTLIKNKEGIDENLTAALQMRLKQTTDTNELDALLATFLVEVHKVEEAKLIAEQNKKYEIWKEEDSIERKKVVNTVSPSQRKASIDKLLADLTEQRQKLWYFENEEQIDLEIFKKIKTYPKRWFGKKKKPRAVDENYVPPEISKKLA